MHPILSVSIKVQSVTPLQKGISEQILPLTDQ